MSKVIYKNDNIEVRSWDVVKLTNGMIVGIFGAAYDYVPNENLPLGEDDQIILSTNPFSSFVSTCYPEHIVEVIEHSGCFENQIDYCHKHSVNQPLYVSLKRGEKE